MFLLNLFAVLFICLPNASQSVTNLQQFGSSPLIPSNPSDLNKFLLFINNRQQQQQLPPPPLRLREGRLRENLRENSRENLRGNLRPENQEIGLDRPEQQQENRPQENRHHNGGHHRDQRRARFEKNLYDSNRSDANQPQWLPEPSQTIWRPYYLPRRPPPSFNLPRHGLVPYHQGNLLNQQIARMPPPYELFPPQSMNNPPTMNSLNARLPPQPPNRFNPVLMDNGNVFNVEMVNGDPQFLPPDQQLNFGNVHSINNIELNPSNGQPNGQPNGQSNGELEKEQPSLEKKINDKLKLDNSSEIQLITSSGGSEFAKPNSALIDLNAPNQFATDPLANRENHNNRRTPAAKLGPADPQLFINRIKQTVVTNESFTSQNSNSKPRLEDKSSLNVSTKILDTSPQQYSPVHFRQTFEQIQAQQKDSARYGQFTPLVYANQMSGIIGPTNTDQPSLFAKNAIPVSTKSSLDVIPQLMNPLTNGGGGQLAANQHLANPIGLSQLMNNPHTSPSPVQPPYLGGPPAYSAPTNHLLKRLQQQQLLARLGSHNLNSNAVQNSIEAARRLNSNSLLAQERATRSGSNAGQQMASSPSSSSPSMAENASKNSKEFFTRRTNTHRYVIVSILMVSILVISIGITVIYVKQRRLNLHQTPTGSVNHSDLGSSYGIRRFYQRSPPSNSASDSDYGPSCLSNRSVATSLETAGSTGAKRMPGNVITHR